MSTTQTDLILTAEDGRPVYAALYEPAQGNGFVAVINSAVLTPRQYYRRFATHLAGRGFTVLTYDYRGVIRPGAHIRDEAGGIIDWGRYDQTAALACALERFAHLRPVMVAHSLGGQIVGLSPLAGRLRAIFMMGTAHGYWRRWRERRRRLRMLFMWHLVAPPLIRALGYFPGDWFGELRLPRKAAWEMRRFCLHPNWLCDEQGRRYRPHNDDIRAPLRHLLVSDDEVVTPGGEIDLADFYPNAAWTEDRRTPADFGVGAIGHFGFFRRTMPEAAWDEVADWLIANG
ncbi:MAG: hypothetical protein AB7Q97_27225 [Gammaproteobacteria bacterium]